MSESTPAPDGQQQPGQPASEPDPPRADSQPGESSAEAAPDAHAQDVLRWRALSRRRNAQSRARRPDTVRGIRNKRPWWVELPILILVAFLATFLIQTFIARVYYVPSGSMEPTLHGVEHGGDRILVYKLGYDYGTPHQGDVVVFKGPPTWTPEASLPGPSTWLGKISQALGAVVGIAPANEKDFVKRVIAVAGQTVSCCDAKGRVQVDGVSLTEPYILMDPGKTQWEWVDGTSSCDVDPDDPSRFDSYRCFGPYTVPAHTVWVMGDHRSDSADSSWNCRGLVPSGDVHCQGPIPVKDVVGRAVAIVMPPSRWGGIGSPDIMAAENSQSGAK